MYQISGFSCGLQSVQNLRTQGMIIIINYNVVDIRYVPNNWIMDCWIVKLSPLNY